MVGFKANSTELFDDAGAKSQAPKREGTRARRALTRMATSGRSLTNLVASAIHVDRREKQKLTPQSPGKANLMKLIGSSFRAQKELTDDAKGLVAKLTRKQLEALVLKKIGAGAISLQEVGGAPGTSDGASPGGAADKGRPGSKLPVALQKRISMELEELLMKDFAEFDTKGTGTVSLDQYIRAMMQLHGDDEEASLVASFQEMDADCDGYISLLEVGSRRRHSE